MCKMEYTEETVLNYIPTITEMEESIARYWNTRQHIIVPNISWGMSIHECDLLIVTKAGYGIEVEIKRSKADLKKDAQKGHGHKHKKIRMLFFAIPEKLRDCIDLIPAHAGIIIIKPYIYPNYTMHPSLSVGINRGAEVNKEAVKFDDKDIMNLSRLGSMRIWNLKRTIIEMNCNIADLRKQIKK